MSKQIPRLLDFLDHICSAIDRIEEYTHQEDETSFLEGRLLQDAVVMNLQVIGEASKNIMRRYPDFAAAHADVQFLSAYEMRNFLAHGYYQVEPSIVWKTIRKELPVFGKQVRKLAESLRAQDADIEP